MKNLTLLLSCIFLFFACDEDNNGAILTVESYPMEIGSEWTYERSLIISYFESEESSNIVEVDTFKFVDNVWIEKDTAFNDTINVKIFKSKTDAYIYAQYMYLDTEGLKTYAYQGAAPSVFAKKTGVNFNYTLNNNFEAFAITDEIFIEEIPRLNIKLPMGIGTSWTYKESTENSPLKITKKVIGTETIAVANNEEICLKVEYEYSNDSNYDDIHATEWYSEKGMIKRTFNFGKITITDENNQTIGYGSSKTVIELSELNIE